MNTSSFSVDSEGKATVDIQGGAECSLDDYLAIEKATQRKGMTMAQYLVSAAAATANLSNAMHGAGFAAEARGANGDV